jgi:hypothetical protein
LNDRPENEKPFVGNSEKIVKDIKEFESLEVSFIQLSFVHENLENTKAYSEKFANEVLSEFQCREFPFSGISKIEAKVLVVLF